MPSLPVNRKICKQAELAIRCLSSRERRVAIGPCLVRPYFCRSFGSWRQAGTFTTTIKCDSLTISKWPLQGNVDSDRATKIYDANERVDRATADECNLLMHSR